MEHFFGRNKQINRVVYSQLSVENVGVNEHHLVKRYEDYKNGCGAWNALCEYYYGVYVNNETSYYLSSKLEIYRLKLESNSEHYINTLLTSF